MSREPGLELYFNSIRSEITYYGKNQSFGIPILFSKLEFIFLKDVPGIDNFFLQDLPIVVKSRLTKLNKDIKSEIEKWWKGVEINNKEEELEMFINLLNEELSTLDYCLPEDTESEEYARVIGNIFIKQNLHKVLGKENMSGRLYIQ